MADLPPGMLEKINEEVGERLKDQPADRPPDRRALLAIAAGAVAAAVATVPKEARADLSWNDIFGAVKAAIEATIQAPIEGTFNLLELALAVFRAIGLPGIWIQVLNEILGLLGSAGDDATTMTGTIPGAMERSWPEEAVYTSGERREMQLQSALATRARVEEACMTCATAAEAQAALNEADVVTLEQILAAGEAGELLSMLGGIATLIVTNSQRISQQILMENQRMAVAADGVIREQGARWLEPQVTSRLGEPIPQTLGPSMLSR